MGGVADFVSDAGDMLGSRLGLSESPEERYAKESRDLMMGIRPPTLRAPTNIDYREFVSPQEASQFGQIQEDPALRAAQMESLSRLGQISQEGYTPEDRAALEQIAREEAVRQRGQRESLLQGAQRRGVGGSGLEMASQLLNQQESAGRESQRGLEVAAEGRRRALQALQMQGNLAGDIRGQEFNQGAQRATAQDLINRFNATNRNVAGTLTAQQRQRGRDIRAMGLPQQQFDNLMRLREAQAGALSGVGTAQGAREQRGGNFIGGVLGGLGGLF